MPPERIWDKETFMAIKGSAPKQPSKKKAKAEPKKPEAQAPAQPAAAPGPDQAATPEEGVQPKGGSKKGKRPADSDSEEDEDVGGSASDEGEEDDRGQ